MIEENKKKKILLLTIIIVLIMTVLIGGATYAFYNVIVNNNTTQTNINSSTGGVGDSSFKSLVSSLSFNLKASDMGKDFVGDYYATSDDNAYSKDYSLSDLVELKIENSPENVKYVCTANLKVTLTGSMSGVLQDGDLTLYLSDGASDRMIDLSTLTTTKEGNYIVKFNITGNDTKYLKGYLKLSNRDTDQYYLANTNINVDLQLSDTNCDVTKEYGDNDLERTLRKYDTNNTLSIDNQAGMFRYQGSHTDVTNNYICFGTDDQKTCTTEEDKYMYRIIGITNDDKLELIKKTALNDEGVQWNSTYRSEWNNSTDVNEKTKDADIPWSKSDLFNKLNGKSDKNDNLFIGNDNYDYLNNNSSWLKEIADTEWISGQLYWSNAYFVLSKIYNIESGKEAAPHYEEANPYYYNGGTDTVSEESLYVDRRKEDEVKCKRYDNTSINKVTCYKTITNQKFNDKVTAKIGLMHVYDYDYAVQKDGLNCFYDNVYDRSNGTDKPKTELTTCKNSWIHMSHNDTTVTGYGLHDWTLSRYGFTPDNDYFPAWHVDSAGLVSNYRVGRSLSARPVFFLNSGISIKDGDGSSKNPFTLNI